MPDYTTTYVFCFDIEGRKAVEKARTLRQQMDQALSGTMKDAGFDALTKSVDVLTNAIKHLVTPLKDFSKTTQQTSANAQKLTGDVGKLAQQFANLETNATRANRSMGGATGGTGQKADIAHYTIPDVQANAELRALYQRVELQKDFQRQHMANQAEMAAAEQAAAATRQREVWRIEEQRRQATNYNRYMGLETQRQQYLTDRKNLTMAKLEPPLPSRMDLSMQAMVGESQKIWPIRSMGYGLQNIGRTMLIQGAAQAAAIAALSSEYLKFDYAATRAGQAMELQTRLQPMLRDEIMATTEAIGRFDTSQVAEGLRQWAAGIGAVVQDQSDLNKIMDETLQIQKLAALNNVDFADTVDVVGGIMHEYGMKTSDVNHITEILNYTAAKSFANVNDLGEAFKYVGPLANTMGISFDETAAALALLSDSNIKGTRAGRAFQQMLISMSKPSAEYNKVMNKTLGITQGTSEAWREIVFPKGQFMGLPKYIDLLASRTEKLTQAERTRRLAVFAEANALPTIITLVQRQIEARQKGINVLSAYSKVMTGVVDSETITFKRMMEEWTGVPFSLESAHALMTGMWEEYEKSDSYRADRLKRRWQNVFIEMGGALTDALLPNLEKLAGIIVSLAEFVENNPFLAHMAIWSTVASLAIGRLIASLGSLAIAWTTLRIAKAGLAATGGVAAGTVGAAAGAGGIAGVIASLGGVAVIAGALVPIALVLASAVAASAVNKEEVQAAERRVETFSAELQERFSELFKVSPAFGGYVPRGQEGINLMVQALGQDFPIAMGLGMSRIVLSGENLARVFDLLTEEARLAAMALTPSQQRAMQSELEYEQGTLKGRIPFRKTPRTYPTAEKALGLDEPQQKIAQTYYDFTKQAEQIETDFKNRRQQIVSSYNTWRIQAEEDLVRRLAQADTDYTREGARRLDDYNSQVAKVNENANRQEAQQERQHLESQRKLQRDHRDRLIDLMEEGDVRGIVKEMRSYRNQRSDLEDQVREERTTRADDRQRRLDEMNEQFKLENARRDEDFKLQQDRAQEQFAIEQEQRRQAIAEQIAELSTEKQRALKDLDDTLVQALSKLLGFATAVEMRVLPIAYRAALKVAQPFLEIFWLLDKLAKIEAQIESLPFGPARDMARSFLSGWDIASFAERIAIPRTIGRQAGGYAGGGIYTLGEKGTEFVVDAPTTRLLTAKFGQLSQDTFHNLGGDSFVYAPNMSFGAGIDLSAARQLWRTDMNSAFEQYATRRRSHAYA